MMPYGHVLTASKAFRWEKQSVTTIQPNRTPAHMDGERSGELIPINAGIFRRKGQRSSTPVQVSENAVSSVGSIAFALPPRQPLFFRRAVSP